MDIKVNHLVELLEYLHKENVLEVDVEKDDKIGRAGYVFSFQDKDNRECNITIFQSGMNIAPDLVKKMKLYTRAGKTRKKDPIGDALREKAAQESSED